MTLKGAALDYWQKGCRIVPLIDKSPLVRWEKWQSEDQNLQEFEDLPWDRANAFAVICGVRLNNDFYVGVLDFDVEKAGKPLPNEVLKKQGGVAAGMPVTQLEETPSGGKHLIYYTKAPVQTKTYDACGIEILGEGKLCIMAPSTGYKRLNDNMPTELENLHFKFEEALEKSGLKPKSTKVQPSYVRKGKKKAKQVRYCCETALERDRHISHLMRLAIAAEYKKAGWSEDDIVNLFRTQTDFDREKCLTQIESADPERAATCESIKEWGYCYPECLQLHKIQKGSVDAESGRTSQANRLVSLALDGIQVFHDDSRNCYARVSHSQVACIYRITSRDFKIWLAGLLWNDTQKAPSADALNSAINVLESKALFEGQQHRLYNRVAPDPDGHGVWIDMCNDRWQTIHVTGESWQIVDRPPILFRRYSHQQPLVTPVRGGDPNLFLKFVNLAEDNVDNRTLLMIAIIHFFIPEIPHVIPVLYGPQGSAKTTLFKVIRSLIDPSSVEVLSIPRDERELIQQLSHHWCAFYDNVGSVRWWVSDALCRAATGGGFTKRELYTDDDDVVYNYRRCIGLNSINIAAQRPDLLDRCLLLGLKHIPKDKRKTEETLWQEFDKVKGEILGGFLDVLSKAIKIYPTIKVDELHRMADFVKWGCAISEALGVDKKKFLAAYDANVELHTEEAARSSPVAEVILKFMAGKLTWGGSPSELYAVVSEKAKEMGVSTRQKAWPKAPNALIRHINELVPALTQLGYEVVETRKDKTRNISINTVTTVMSEKVHENVGKKDDDTKSNDDTKSSSGGIPSSESDGKTPSNDDNDGNDGICTTSSGEGEKSHGQTTLDDVKAPYWDPNGSFNEHECCVCGYRKMTSWQAETFKGQQLWICEDCKLEWEKRQGA